MAFIQRISVMMMTSLVILYTIPLTTSISPSPSNIILDAPTMIVINRICQNTVDENYCEHTIIPKLDSPHAEITTIAKITAFNALYNSKITIVLIRDDFILKAVDPLTKAKLRTCLAAYNVVGKYLDGAYRAVLRNDSSEMIKYQSYVFGFLDNCKPDFAPMERRMWLARLLINISILAARML